MKPLKTAEQRNVMLNTFWYRDCELEQMLKGTFEIFQIDNHDKENNVYRLDLDYVKDLKVVYNKEYGTYETIAVCNNTNIYHVEV